MKLVCISGSPRVNGNSATLIEEFSKHAENKNYEVTNYQLNKLNYKGCQGCMACKTGGSNKCVVKDDLTILLQDIETADIILLASPVYLGDVTAQAKGFLDRLYSFLTPDFYTAEKKTRLKDGKKFIFASVQGSPVEEQFDDIYPRYSFFLKWFFSETHLIRECGCISKKTIEKDQKRLDNIKKIANEVL